MKHPLGNHPELHTNVSPNRQNWLRAAVLGANDGIVSLAALIVGVAGAAASSQTILVTGIAGLLAGALSMAVGEYVSVSSQRDTEKALLAKERYELEHYAENELDELTMLYQKKGLTPGTARTVAEELTKHDAFAAHVDIELGIDPHNLTQPWQAAVASALSFTAGALIPLIAIMLPPYSLRIPAVFGAVLIALIVTGIFSARTSGVRVLPVTARVVLGGVIAMAITFGIGKLFNISTI
jgi:VIT1/CCC1 family predicted Fe2+/Mn2+ transporter